MTRRHILGGGAFLAAVLTLACGGGGGTGGGSPTAPTPTTPTTPGGGGGTSTTTITIGSDGRVTPSAITVSAGAQVTFVNNDSRAHDMSSDPHPDHTDCPPINQVGFLQPGQSRQTGNLTTAGTCGFHDHNQPANAALRGTITIQ
jgi:plastocyanin